MEDTLRDDDVEDIGRKYRDLVRAEIDHESDIARYGSDIEQLQTLVKDTYELIKKSKEEGVALLKKLSSRNVVTAPGVATVAPAAKASRAPLPRDICCGINGCDYMTSNLGIKKHRDNCTGPLPPCVYCGKKEIFPGRQREHNRRCGKAPWAKAFPPSSTEAADVLVSLK